LLRNRQTNKNQNITRANLWWRNLVNSPAVVGSNFAPGAIIWRSRPNKVV